MAVVLVIVLTAVVVVVVAFVGSAAGTRYRTRKQTRPIGPPLAATGEVIVALTPDAARDTVIELLAARGAHPRLVTSSQLIFAPRLFPTGPLGRLVFVWFTPSVGVDADSTALLIEAQELFQPRRYQGSPETGPPASAQEVGEIVAALTATDGGATA
jgi:hypothetical protein